MRGLAEKSPWLKSTYNAVISFVAYYLTNGPKAQMEEISGPQE